MQLTQSSPHQRVIKLGVDIAGEKCKEVNCAEIVGATGKENVE